MDKIGCLLHFAYMGDVDSVKMLLDEGLPVDSPDYDGRTAMHLAASEGHYNVIKFLLENHAHVNPVDRWRKTVIEFIIEPSGTQLLVASSTGSCMTERINESEANPCSSMAGALVCSLWQMLDGI